MSGEALYERYKDALKRGHVASLRGRIDDSLAAYAEAARIAPERSTPHTSAGTALLRRKRPADALRHFETALRIAPRDEAAMLGRAQALAALGRRADAADMFDALAELHASSGRLADAVDGARRGLELAEGRHRRRTLALLIGRLRDSEPDEPGRVALERALRVLDGPALPAGLQVATVAGGRDAADASLKEPPAAASAEGMPGRPEPEPAIAPEPELAVEPEPEPELAVEPEPEPEPEPVVPLALDRPLPEPLDLEALARDAERALDTGDPSASDRLLDLAAACLREGRINAALDACYEALALRPDDASLHLALVRLYDHEGWTALASEKLDLLARLADLGDDQEAAARIAAVRTGRA
jgi:tetratricopeptide (TPR) repeat protein